MEVCEHDQIKNNCYICHLEKENRIMYGYLKLIADHKLLTGTTIEQGYRELKHLANQILNALK